MKHQHNHEEELKHNCQCENHNCEETNEHCECNDCHCGDHDCHCDEHGCKCENCDCEDCHCDEHGCECDDCHCDEHGCDCEDCECDDHGCDCEGCDSKEETQEKESKEKEYLEGLQRLQAEFDNYRKRNDLISLKAKEEGIILAVEKILPVLDSFKSAEKFMTEEDLKGLNLIKEQLNKALTDMGVTKINALNEVFNPDFHNAVLMGEDNKKESHTVLEVYQDGYILKDKVIRHSMVKINK